MRGDEKPWKQSEKVGNQLQAYKLSQGQSSPNSRQQERRKTCQAGAARRVSQSNPVLRSARRKKLGYRPVACP